MPEIWRFPILMAVSVIVLAAIIWGVAPQRARKSLVSVLLISVFISAGGMTFAKFGANNGWPVAVYYGVPAALTLFLPPLFFRMNLVRTLLYLALAYASAPAIHFGAVYFLGWDNYMPFLGN